MENLSDFYSYRLIGKLTDFLELPECSTFSSMLKSRVGNILTKAEDLRNNLNLDGTTWCDYRI
jgi:hypothetical protein